MNFFSKTILFLIVFLLIFNSSGFLKSGFLKFIPPKAEAVWWSTLPVQLIQYAEDIWEYIKDNWQTLMRDIIAKRLIDYIVDETVKWISGGGNPKFVTDWKGFLNDAGKIAQDSIIKEVGLAPLCKPFKLQVQIGLLPVKKFSQRIECTLDDIVKNIDNFYADFSQGGWIAYGAMWEPQNNFFGASIIAHDEALARAAKETESRKNDAIGGAGFLSAKKCEGGGTKTSYCLDSSGGDSELYQTCMNMSWSEEEICSNTGGKMKINTPGSTIGATVAKAVTSDIDWSANIESWVSALVNAAINRLIKEGISSLNNSNNSDYSGSSYYPDEYKDIRNVDYNEEKQRMIKQIREIAVGVAPGDLEKINNLKQELISLLKERKGILEDLMNLQSSVDSIPSECLPVVDNSEIIAIDMEIDRLSSSSGSINDEENEVISVIETADFSNSQERSEAYARYSEFVRTYNTNSNYEGNLSAETVLQNKIDAERNEKIPAVQGRYRDCEAAIPPPQNATTTNATST